MTDEEFHRGLNKWVDSIEKEFGVKIKRHPMPKPGDRMDSQGVESTDPTQTQEKLEEKAGLKD